MATRVRWKRLLEDPYGAKNLAYHLIASGQTDYFERLRTPAIWDVLTLGDMQNIGEEEILEMRAKTEFVIGSLDQRKKEEDTEADRLEVELHLQQGVLFAINGDLEKGADELKIALAFVRKTRNLNTQATVLCMLSILMRQSGNFDASKLLCQDALTIWRKSNKLLEAATGFYILGTIEFSLANYEGAFDRFNQAREQLRPTPANQQKAYLQLKISESLREIAFLQGERSSDIQYKTLARAKVSALESVSIAQSSDNERLIIQSYLEAGRVYQDLARLQDYRLSDNSVQENMYKGLRFTHMAVDLAGETKRDYLFEICLDMAKHYMVNFKDRSAPIEEWLQRAAESIQANQQVRRFGKLASLPTMDVFRSRSRLAQLSLIRGVLLMKKTANRITDFEIKRITEEFAIALEYVSLVPGSTRVSREVRNTAFQSLRSLDGDNLKVIRASLDEFEAQEHIQPPCELKKLLQDVGFFF